MRRLCPAPPLAYLIMLFGIKSHRHEVEHARAIDEGAKIFLRDAGIDPDAYEGSVADTRIDIQRAKRERAKRLGSKEWDHLTDGQLSDGGITGLFPNIQMGMHAEGVFIMRFEPHATDPERFYYDNILLYRHVDEPNYRLPDATTRRNLDAVRGALTTWASAKVETWVTRGDAIDQLLSFAQEHEVDLIVGGLHGRTFHERAIMHNAALWLMAVGDRTVLLVPPED